MVIEALSVLAFRNLQNVQLEASPGMNVICGQNGQGKTNLLECIWLFTGGRSFTNGTPAEMVPFGAAHAQVQLQFFGVGRSQTMDYRLGAHRRIQKNQITQKSLSALAGSFFAVIFSPDSLSLVKGSPEGRRQVLDMTICQLKPRYHTLLQQHHRLLTQRNALIKAIRNQQTNEATLPEWDMALATAAAMITKTRRSYVERLTPLAQGIYQGISSDREQLHMQYSDWALENEPTAPLLFSILEQNRKRDLAAGTTLTGAHRDDLQLLLDGRSAKSFGSQGQQRSVVLALKIAECDLIEQVTEERPVILLDDVMSELDEGRRQFLLHRLQQRQIFLTCCDPGQIAGAKTVFTVDAGRVQAGPTIQNG